jgi:polyferredoxin
MQIPFYVIVSVIWAFEFVLGILRGVGQGPIGTLTVVISVFYGVVALFTSIFFIHYGRKLMATLQSAKSRVEQQKKSKSKFQVKMNGLHQYIF